VQSDAPQRKVFAIGLSKTGNSSLTEALNQLEIRALHYPHDGRTYDELRRGRYRLSILEEVDAIVDMPAVAFYRQLDAEYPGSKFILMVRELEDWLRSAEVHWRLMEGWMRDDAEFRRMHEFLSRSIYGATDFDRRRFAARYREHEAEVRRHFAGRPDDLLVIDICGGEGWETLCPFLDKPIPRSPFPHANEWMHRLLQAKKELGEALPPASTLILVDQCGFGDELTAGHACLRLLGRDGEYWGDPPDSATAIADLERLRSAGAEFLVFGWPAYWWFDYYREFDEYLRRRFRLITATDCITAYDLRAPATSGRAPAKPRTREAPRTATHRGA
jgi:Sulfotransferase domain